MHSEETGGRILRKGSYYCYRNESKCSLLGCFVRLINSMLRTSYLPGLLIPPGLFENKIKSIKRIDEPHLMRSSQSTICAVILPSFSVNFPFVGRLVTKRMKLCLLRSSFHLISLDHSAMDSERIVYRHITSGTPSIRNQFH